MRGKSGWLFGMTLAACHLAMAATSVAPLKVVAAWVRWLPGQLPAGGYLTLTNTGDQALHLTGASSEDYASVSLHRSVEHEGSTQMLPVPRLDIAPHATLDFAAQGYHLMLQQPRRTLAPGATVTVTLHFADGASASVPMSLRKPDATPAAASDSGGMKDMGDMKGMPGMH